MTTLAELRSAYEVSSNRSMSMPIAGTIVWFLIGVAAFFLPFKTALLVLVISTGMIFPLALQIAKVRKEKLLDSSNPLAKLMLYCIVMVNLLWGVHVPLLMMSPQFVPLSLGIALGLHWIVFSWIIQHNLGIIHAVLRTVLIVDVWFAFPDHRISGVAFAVCIAYLISLRQMHTRKIN